jgi:peptidyl-tRNA hydrolase
MCTQVAVKVKDGLLTMMAMERTSIAPGDPVKLAIAPHDVHVFDRAAGRRID